MNRKSLLRAALPAAVFALLTHGNAHAFIQFENFNPAGVTRVVYPQQPSKHMPALVESLERITGLDLEIHDRYLRVRESEPLPLLYAGSGMREVVPSGYADRHYSPTARKLLLGAIRSANVYKVEENSGAALGRVDSNQVIELDFGDLNRIVYRDLPRETFDAGMIFLHELVHRHLRLKDPGREEILKDSAIKGPTVEYLNRIERELGLPERRHYAPIKIRYARDEPMWGIYFGNETDRVEFDARFVLK